MTSIVALTDPANVSIQQTNGSPLICDQQTYATQLDASANPVYYVGQSAVGSSLSAPVWRIYKMDTTGGSISITWAGGNSNFTNAWTSRTSLTYS
jgi:hypothetical protein